MIDILKTFVKEYHQSDSIQEDNYKKTLLGDIQKVANLLLNEQFLPSIQLKQILNKQMRKAKYPIEVAIVGQFSSGKSTFLNALLSKNILPTGITPVTSKVNFLNYGSDYQLKITYYSGAQEYHPIEYIATFTDQRKEKLDDVKYLTVYAPLDILKDISFVDTPGLNSQSQTDTQTTINILKDVGGIIWLSLMDNAGKLSEQEVLEEYMQNFKTKSLCVLNQKDKFSNEQINDTTSYIRDNFAQYFDKVIPISAKMALNARMSDKNILMDDLLKNLMLDLKVSLDNDLPLNQNCNNFIQDIKEIKLGKINQNQDILEQSNINDVLNYINNVMAPNAMSSKEWAIKKDLQEICSILMREYGTIGSVYEKLSMILEKSKTKSNELIDKIKVIHSKDTSHIYSILDNLTRVITTNIYDNIHADEIYYFDEYKTKVLKHDKIKKSKLETFTIDDENIFKALLYDDQITEKTIKKAVRLLNKLEMDREDDLEHIYHNMKQKILFWQEQYMLLRKNRQIASDLEFASVRKFASQVYENILQAFHILVLKYISKFDIEISYLKSLLTNSYTLAIKSTVSYFEKQLKEAEELNKTNPLEFPINKPTEDKILLKLKENILFEKIDYSLNKKLNANFELLRKEYEQYHNEKSLFIAKNRDIYIDKIDKLNEIRDTIQ